MLFNDLKQQIRVGKRVVERKPFAHLAHEIHQQHIEAAPADFYADKKRAIRVEHDGHRRLADLAALRRQFQYQRFVEQAVDDQRDGLRT